MSLVSPSLTINTNQCATEGETDTEKGAREAKSRSVSRWWVNGQTPRKASTEMATVMLPCAPVRFPPSLSLSLRVQQVRQDEGALG